MFVNLKIGFNQVLEVGGGSGSNFSFVETSVDWTVTEPNLCFESYFLDNCKDWNGKHDIGKLVEVQQKKSSDIT